jgi:hypothetical protein
MPLACSADPLMNTIRNSLISFVQRFQTAKAAILEKFSPPIFRTAEGVSVASPFSFWSDHTAFRKVP